MKRKFLIYVALILILPIGGNVSAQIVENDSGENLERNPKQNAERNVDYFLGLKLSPEIRTIIREIERKTGNEISGEFGELDEFMLGASFITKDGVPVVHIDYKLEDGDYKKLEAVIVHELLHLRLTSNGYPAFLFSDNINMTKGRAIDTEQSNINDLRSLIEHQIFKADMQKFGLYKYIDLAGDTAKLARNQKGQESGQDSSINYARAILEYPNQKDIQEVKNIYTANKWTRALREGETIAGMIGASNIKTPADAEALFLKCITVLYPMPNTSYNFKLTLDPKIKTYRRMIVSIARRKVTAPRRSKRN